MAIREGEAFVEGTGPDVARDLLAKAADAGLPASAVRLDPTGGFVVPAELVTGKAPAKKPATRRKSTKSAKGKE